MIDDAKYGIVFSTSDFWSKVRQHFGSICGNFINSWKVNNKAIVVEDRSAVVPPHPTSCAKIRKYQAKNFEELSKFSYKYDRLTHLSYFWKKFQRCFWIQYTDYPTQDKLQSFFFLLATERMLNLILCMSLQKWYSCVFPQDLSPTPFIG